MKPVARAVWPLMILALLVLIAASLVVGRTELVGLDEAPRGVAAALGLAEPLEGATQTVLELRLWRALSAAGVGAALALAGALLQGVFRNPLAAPSVIGVSSGASLGAAAAIMTLGGHAPMIFVKAGHGFASVLVMLSSFAGALLAVVLVVVIASRRGKVSMPALLLTGIAINACCGGLLAAIQALSLADYEVSRAIFAWTFGSLDDKSSTQVVMIWSALALGLLVVPFVSTELDLLAGGDDDARALGVRTDRTRALSVGAAAFVAATSVAVAGQIAFVGLIVPHVMRSLFGRRHRELLPICVLGGALFLVGTEWLQLTFFGRSALRPGIFMSLVGGPFFLLLLVRNRREVTGW